MKKQFILIIFTLALAGNTSILSANNENQIFSTDININKIQNQDLNIPLPLIQEDKGVVYDTIFGWDENSPFTSHQRPAIIASNSKGLIEIQNTRWGYTSENKTNWEAAYINPQLLDKVYYGTKNQLTLHTLMIFVFKPGGFINSKGEDGIALAISVEGWYRENPGYSPIDGMKDRYPLIFKATTVSDYANYVIKKENQELFLREMNLTKSLQSKLLKKVTERIIKNNNSQEFYQTIRNSCTIVPVQIYNSILPKQQQIKIKLIGGLTNLNATWPAFALKRYIKLGVVNPKSIDILKENVDDFDFSILRN
jgi:Domain of unknown function (DUF4105)